MKLCKIYISSSLSAVSIYNTTALNIYIYICLYYIYIIYICSRVEQSLYNRHFIGYYNSVACQAVSKTLPQECSIGFVPWLNFLPAKKYVSKTNHLPYINAL